MDEDVKINLRCNATGCYSKVKKVLVLDNVGVQIAKHRETGKGRISFVPCIIPVCLACGNLVEAELTRNKKPYTVRTIEEVLSNKRYSMKKRNYKISGEEALLIDG